MSPEDACSMCCRLRLANRELLKRGGGLFGANPLTGFIGVVTINLPPIGYISKIKGEFYSHLIEQIQLAVERLSIKRKVLEKFTANHLYPYSKFYLREVKNASGSCWKNHFSTIGLIGMNEACLNFIGEDITTDHGQQAEYENHLCQADCFHRNDSTYVTSNSRRQAVCRQRFRNNEVLHPEFFGGIENEYSDTELMRLKVAAEPHVKNCSLR
jgi:hypothetical protein